MIATVSPVSVVDARVSRRVLVPVHSSTSPGSTTRVSVRSEKARRVVGTVSSTVTDWPGSKCTRR